MSKDRAWIYARLNKSLATKSLMDTEDGDFVGRIRAICGKHVLPAGDLKLDTVLRLLRPHEIKAGNLSTKSGLVYNYLKKKGL